MDILEKLVAVVSGNDVAPTFIDDPEVRVGNVSDDGVDVIEENENERVGVPEKIGITEENENDRVGVPKKVEITVDSTVTEEPTLMTE